LRLSPLAVLPLDRQGADFTHLDWPSVSRRQVLLFPASACDELTPPLRRTPPGPHAGSSLVGDAPQGCVFVPRLGCCPGFGVIVEPFGASAVVYACSSSRRLPDPLVAGLFRSRFPPRLLTGMTLRRFGISACTANPEDLPPSLVEHVSFWRSSTSSSLHFQDTPPPGALRTGREPLSSSGSHCPAVG
jgi:hypothetical protein